MEDPRKLLDQAVTDMQADLIKMRQTSAQVRSLCTPKQIICTAHLLLVLRQKQTRRSAASVLEAQYGLAAVFLTACIASAEPRTKL